MKEDVFKQATAKRHYMFRDHDSGEVVFECDSNTMLGAKKQFRYWSKKAKNKQI